jgi:hypothetical protein
MTYITRGDSNNADDVYKPTFDNVLGEYTDTRVPYVGAFLMFLQSYSGIITILAVIYCLIMIESASDKIRAAREERVEFLQEAIGFEDDTVPDEKLDMSFTETVYFKDYAYTFGRDGLISKEKISGQAAAHDINSVPEEGTDGAVSGDADGE